MDWESLNKQAKALESVLESKLAKYSSHAHKLSSQLLYEDAHYHDDEEADPMLAEEEARREEGDMSAELERALNELGECIQRMTEVASPTNAHHDVLIQRYREIHFDYSSEYKSTCTAIHRKRESAQLFRSSRNREQKTDEDSAIAKLLRERNSISNSMRSLQNVIGQALQTRDVLANNRRSLTGSSSALGGISSNIPSINRVIEAMQKKKTRDNMILGLVIGICICVVVWWWFL